MSRIAENLEKLLGTSRDNALLRYSLGAEYLKEGDFAKAAAHLREALQRDPGYSAAWKLLGKTLAETGDVEGAIDAYEKGIVAAGERGDRQAAKEMTLFARRLAKPQP
ncbi:MAG: tetratricopeptide repeat protein [Betaproteobacteria bacterium]|nr:tetratricopeptide repeat protein [Betaproteobacteria bacterium]